MARSAQKLTQTRIAKLAPGRTYWDTEVRGFGVNVRKKNSSFVLQRDLHGRTIKITIGRMGVWTAEKARQRARELVAG